MPRPQSNNADYFPHKNGMRNHRKIKMLRNKFGSILGYAFWSMMLEYLTEHDGLEWEYSEIEIEMFAAELGVSAAEIPPMVDYCIKINLLSKSDSDFIFSESLNEVLSPVFEKRKRERQRSKERERKESGQFKTAESTTSGGVSAADIPQSKVEYSKEKKSIDTNVSSPATQKQKEDSFLLLFNKTTKREFRILDKKTKTQFSQLLKDGYNSKDFKKTIITALAEMTERGREQYLTPEFITRPAEFSKYVNMVVKDKTAESAVGATQFIDHSKRV